ncbi:MAG: M48 family metallopeptidase [Bryobacterales bacterium]
MRHRWPGGYFDGRTAARVETEVSLSADGVELLFANGARTFWPYSQIRQTQGELEGEPTRLERGEEPAEAVVVDLPGFLEALHGYTLEVVAAGRDRSIGIGQILLALTAAALIGSGLYFWGAHALGDLFAAALPPSWEERLGDAAIRQFAPEEDRCDDEVKQQAVEAIVQRLADARTDRRYDYSLVIASGMVNAFAAPGGRMAVFDELIAMTDNPEELAGVMAHEIEHVERRHSTRALFRDLTVNAIQAAVTGDLASGVFAMDGAATLATLAHHRDEELEADAEGLKLLRDAHIDPNGMVTMFEKFAKLEGGASEGVSYLSTHPATKDRIARLKAMIQQDPGDPRPIELDVHWARVKAPCRVGF